MKFAMNAQCYLCHLRRNTQIARELGSEEQVTAFARDLMELYLALPEEASSPWLGPETNRLYQQHFGTEKDRYREEKHWANQFVLQHMDRLRRQAQSAEDPLYAAIQLSILGNYLDFAALQGEVRGETLEEMLLSASHMVLDPDTYARFCQELAAGKKLLIFTDNAGEIGFDRILAEEISKKYPHLEITFCVRGDVALNDATREDARAVGIPFPVIDSGSDIAGTVVSLLGETAKQAMDQADVIIAKGQANVETLFGCGYPIYYLFLIKCALFMDTFGKPKLTPMLVREER